jgi:hypothetical protein
VFNWKAEASAYWTRDRQASSRHRTQLSPLDGAVFLLRSFSTSFLEAVIGLSRFSLKMSFQRQKGVRAPRCLSAHRALTILKIWCWTSCGRNSVVEFQHPKST